MYIDYKVTTWRRMELPDDMTKEEALEYLIRESVGRFCSGTAYSDLGATEDHAIDDCETDMTVEENQGGCTAELFEDSGAELWNNLKGERNERA